MILSTERVGSIQAGQRHLFPFSSIHTQGSGNKEVYLVGECSIESNGGVESRDLLPFSYSSPTLPIVSRPQKNHPCADIDSNSLPAVQVSSYCMITVSTVVPSMPESFVIVFVGTGGSCTDFTGADRLFSMSCADVEGRQWPLPCATAREWRNHRVRHACPCSFVSLGHSWPSL